MPVRPSKFTCRYLTSSALVSGYPFLVAATLAKQVEAGLIRVDGNGRRCEQDAINQYVANLTKEIERIKNKQEIGSVKDEIDKARLRKLELEADIIQIDRDLKRGELIETSAAIAEVEEAFARVRTRLLGVPDRLALELSAISDPMEIRQLLNDVMRETLQELHTELTSDSEEDGDSNQED